MVDVEREVGGRLQQAKQRLFDVHPPLDDLINIFRAQRRRVVLTLHHQCPDLPHIQGRDITKPTDQVLKFYILRKQSPKLLLIIGQKQHIPNCISYLLGLYINLLPVFEIYFFVDNLRF